MTKRYATVHAGRRIEVEPGRGWSGTTVRLLVDGEVVAHARGSRRVAVSADGLEARTWLAWHGEGLHARRARRGRRRVATGSARPPPGTLAAGREAFARRHPALYAGHHAAAGVGKVLAGLIGASLLVGLLPDISIGLPLPSIDLPLPSIDLPGIALPQPPEPPAWLRAVLDSAKCWGPILAGIAYAVVEYRRRRRHGMARRHESQRRGGGAGGSPARGGERPAGR